MKYLMILMVVAFTLFSLPPAFAKIIYVPGDSSTIQAGIDGAVYGDTVLVAPGIYTEHIRFGGKAILVTSSAVEPPPIIVVASRLASNLAMARVPSAN